MSLNETLKQFSAIFDQNVLITLNTPTQQAMVASKKDQETSRALTTGWCQLSSNKKSASLQN